MTISVWRYSHLALALSSFLLLVLAAITGVILAFEPVALKTLPYKIARFEEVNLAQAIPAVQANFEEVTEFKVDANQFVIVKGIDGAGADVTAYIDARTGKIIGTPEPQSDFFQWVTAFHRSLFLHELGRFFVGLATFLLLLITTSGIALIIQRQRGVKRFFTKVIRENFAQYYHVTLGRLLLLPLLIITISGTYLSLVRFKLIPDQFNTKKVDFDAIKAGPIKKTVDFEFFRNTKLADVKSIEFPFSTDVEDYYTLKLKDREVTVNQVTGEVLTETLYPITVLLTEWSIDLHTGRTSMVWAIVLAIASANILFFIYSGFAITLRRRSGRIKNKYKSDECNYIILVGSENGNTFHFAKAVYQQCLKNGKKCFIAELNSYQTYPQATHMLVFTATYGLGEAPANARRFLSLILNTPQPANVNFSVLGFGSKSYPDYCKFAFEVNNALSLQDWAVPFVEIHTVNDRSPDEFEQWLKLWAQKTEIQLQISSQLLVKPKKNQQFKVVKKTLGKEGDSFLVQLQPMRATQFTSGDLLAIYPQQNYLERLYSIGKVGKLVQLSVKLHENGIGSTYLHQLTIGQKIEAQINSNPSFHFPKKSKTVILICNGTGIAPFLGMIDQKSQKVDCHLYCGFRANSSFDLYRETINTQLANHQLTSLKVAYSREESKQYVSDLVAADQDLMANVVANGGTIMICGSLAMQKDIVELLAVVFSEKNQQPLSYYQSRNQILMDCY